MPKNSKVEELRQMLMKSSEEWEEARTGDESEAIASTARRDRDAIEGALVLLVAAIGEEELLHAVGGIVEDEAASDFEIFALTTTCAVHAKFDSGGAKKATVTHRSALTKLEALRAEYSLDGKRPLLREYYVEYQDGPRVFFPLRKNKPTPEITALFHELRDDLSFSPN